MSRVTQAGDDEIFSLRVANPSTVTNLTNDANKPAKADDRYVDWQSTGPLTSITVGNAGCAPATAALKTLGGRVQWNFTSASAHTAVDASGLGLFDAGSHMAPYTYWSSLIAAGTRWTAGSEERFRARSPCR